MLRKQNKYYVDPTMYLDADAVARQAQAVFPKIRFGVGPAALNAHFDGDEKLIVAHLSQLPRETAAEMKSGVSEAKTADIKPFVPVPSTPAREDSAPPESIQYKEGDVVFVSSLGIEAKIKNVLPHGIVNVELADGITETMLAKNLEPVQKGATESSSMTAAPRPANDAASPAAPSNAAPPAVPSSGPGDASTTPNAVPPPEATSHGDDGDTASRGES